MRRGAAGTTESFVSQSAGDGEWVIAAPTSKCALANVEGRLDAICCVKWDTLNGRYVFHPSIQYVGLLDD